MRLWLKERNTKRSVLSRKGGKKEGRKRTQEREGITWILCRKRCLVMFKDEAQVFIRTGVSLYRTGDFVMYGAVTACSTCSHSLPQRPRVATQRTPNSPHLLVFRGRQQFLSSLLLTAVVYYLITVFVRVLTQTCCRYTCIRGYFSDV